MAMATVMTSMDAPIAEERLMPITAGTTWDGVRRLESPEIAALFDEGDEGVLELSFAWDVAANAAQWLGQQLQTLARAAGFDDFADDYTIRADGPRLQIRATYGLWPLWALVGAALALLIALSLVNWTFFKVVHETGEQLGAAGTLVAIVAAAVVAIVVARGALG